MISKKKIVLKDFIQALGIMACAILIVVVLFWLIVFFSLYSYENKGTNNQPFEVYADFYVSNPNTSFTEVNELISGTNQIWEKYNITIIPHFIQKTNISFDEGKILMDNNLSNESCNTAQEILKKVAINSTNSSLKIILLNQTYQNAGRGCICNCDYIVIDTQVKVMNSWNLAHELGHIFGVSTRCKRNLMIEYGNCAKNKSWFTRGFIALAYELTRWNKPSFLNQEQINQAINKIESNSIKENKQFLK